MKYSIIIFTLLLVHMNLQGQTAPCALTGDRDNDGLCNDIDPCPDAFNPNPVDADNDGVYDACDNSPVYNPDQADIDGDGVGDVSDSCIDPDGDGVCGSDDECPNGDDNIDVDFDGTPDACDDCIDRDRDGICDDVDECISTDAGTPCDDGDDCTENDELDRFCDCVGTFRDADNDGVCDLDDKCPESDDSRDFDNDGIPDACDDSPVCNGCELDENYKMKICHFYIGGKSATIFATCNQLAQYFDNIGDFVNSKDHCGPCTCADKGDLDTDGDGLCDKIDPCPTDPNDSDGDGVCDSKDACPGSDDTQDKDGDGIPDGCDDIEYCIPTADNTYEWIASLEIDDRTMEGSAASGFFIHADPAQLEKGKSHTLTINPESIDDICQLSIHLYMDWNQDGDFEDAGEEVMAARSLESIIISLNIDNQKAGEYRGRVIVHYGRIPNSCPSLVDGEVEDFFIDVIDALPCSFISEPFDYIINTPLTELNGGIGWEDRWVLDSENPLNQIAITNGSLTTEGSGNRIGILNMNGSAISITRPVDINLTGSESFSFSMTTRRFSGFGSLDITIGNLAFGFSNMNEYYLIDQTADLTEANAIHELLVNIVIHNDGQEEIFFWIDPTDNPTIEDAITASIELGNEITALTITTQSTDSFLPLTHYIDEIHMGCDSNFEKAKSSKAKQLKRNSAILHDGETKLTSLDVWPNPVHIDNASILIEGNQDTYSFQILSSTGESISQGTFLNGLNRLPVLHQPAGFYYVLVDTDNGVVSKKVVAEE